MSRSNNYVNKDFEIVVPKGKPEPDTKTLLENDIAPEVQKAVELVLQDLPSIKDNLPKEVLEKELLNLQDVHYKASKLRNQGKSFQEIGKILNIDTYTAKKYVERVLQLHYNLYPRESELLVQQVVEELDMMKSHLYEEAKKRGQFTEEGGVYLSKDQVVVGLGVIDRQVKVLGIEPPKRVQIELSDEVLNAQERMRTRLAAYNAIDVTPRDNEDKP